MPVDTVTYYRAAAHARIVEAVVNQGTMHYAIGRGIVQHQRRSRGREYTYPLTLHEVMMFATLSSGSSVPYYVWHASGNGPINGITPLSREAYAQMMFEQHACMCCGRYLGPAHHDNGPVPVRATHEFSPRVVTTGGTAHVLISASPWFTSRAIGGATRHGALCRVCLSNYLRVVPHATGGAYAAVAPSEVPLNATVVETPSGDVYRVRGTLLYDDPHITPLFGNVRSPDGLAAVGQCERVHIPGCESLRTPLERMAVGLGVDPGVTTDEGAVIAAIEPEAEPEPEQDDGYDEDEDENSGSVTVYGRSPYHSSYRDMWPGMADEVRQSGDVPVGIELETRATETVDVCPLKVDGWLAERDGSLDDETGVEFITPPLPMSECMSAKGRLASFVVTLREYGFIGWDAGTGYGMHINVDRKSFVSREHQACFVLLINNAQALSELVGGRRETHWALYNAKGVATAERLSGCNTSDHYSAVCVHQEALEVRIFRSTLKVSSVLKNVEFVCAAFEYTKKGDLKRALNTESFYKHIMRCTRKYPNLAAFLRAKSHPSNAKILANDGSESTPRVAA